MTLCNCRQHSCCPTCSNNCSSNCSIPVCCCVCLNPVPGNRLPPPFVTSPPFSCSATPIISGTGTPGAIVTLNVNGQTYTATVAGDTTWVISITTPLTPGSFVAMTLTQSMPGAVTSLPTNFNLLIADIVPLTITSPASSVPQGLVTIAGNTAPNSTVVLTLNMGTPLTVIADSLGFWSQSVNLSAGNYTLVATATDSFGCESEPAFFSFVVTSV